jgi:hypothetical protein
MTSSKGPSFFRPILAALDSALKRGILGETMDCFHRQRR